MCPLRAYFKSINFVVTVVFRDCECYTVFSFRNYNNGFGEAQTNQIFFDSLSPALMFFYRKLELIAYLFHIGRNCILLVFS